MAVKDKPDSIEAASPNLLVPQKKSSSAMGPIIAVVVLVPVLVYAVMDFMIIPRLKGAMGSSGGHSTEAHSDAKKDGVKAPGEFTAEFGSMVVNLAGSGSSRYLRTNFVIASADPKIGDIVKENESALKDAAISVLSSQSLGALDNANGREVVRKGLISRFNRLLGAEVVDQIYFSEFVVQ
jgi:flagellar FliL protein